MFVEGRLRNREYEAKIDGRKEHRTEIVASRVQFLGASSAETTEAAVTEDSTLSADSDIPF